MNKKNKHEELPLEDVGSIIKAYHLSIRWAVKLLALLMTIIIFISVIDVIFEIIHSIVHSKYWIPRQKEIFTLFGAVMTTLIAIEIFINVRIYLGSDEIPVRLVIATALMAIARKLIAVDIETLTPLYILSFGITILALGIVYIFMEKKI